MTRMDPFTLSLLTNREVLEMHRESLRSRELLRTEDEAVWTARDKEGRERWIALFNLSDEERIVRCRLEEPAGEGGRLRELWTGEEVECRGEELAVTVPAHGVKVFSR